MSNSKILSDIIASATSAKSHFEIWWAQVHDARPSLVGIMNKHSDFFRASADAHYTAFFVYIAHLYDRRTDSSSIRNYLQCIQSDMVPEIFSRLQNEYEKLALRASPLLAARHKTVAHVDAKLTEREVFLPLEVTWDQIRDIIYESAVYVGKLANTTDLGSIGIPRDRRLVETTLKLIKSLQVTNQGRLW